MANGWGIYYAVGSNAGNPGSLVFNVDSFSDLKYTGSSKVSDFPVEQGSFASYNKVVEPFKVNITLTANGTDKTIPFLAQLEIEKSAANLYNIVTPAITYINATLESYDYSRTASNGVSMITAVLSFIEIRQITPAYTTIALKNSKNPTSKGKTIQGKSQTQSPSSANSTGSTAVSEPLSLSNVAGRAHAAAGA
jgi:hypothetical protein